MTVDCILFVRRARLCVFLILLVALWLGGAASELFASQSAELTWSPSSSENIVAYQVFYGTQSRVYPNSITVSNVTEVMVPGLAEGVTYYFAVSAIDSSGDESPPSSEAVYTVPAPGLLTLQVQGTTVAQGAVQLSWTPSSDSDVLGYAVNYGLQSGVYTNAAYFWGTTNGIIGGLTPGITYYFALSPIDSYGVGAVASGEVSYAVPAPVPLVLQAQTPADSSGVELTWNAIPNEGIVSYYVYYGTQSGAGNYTQAMNCGDVTDFIVHGLVAGQTYYFAVAPVDSYNNLGPFSNEASAVASSSVPISLQVQTTNSAIDAVAVSWTASPDSDVTGYVIEFGTQSGVYSSSASFDDTTNGMITGLAGGTTYYFAVAPVDAYGLEPIASSEVTYTVPALPPIVLQARAFTNAPGVELSWNAITNEGIAGYDILYGTASGSYTSGTMCGDVTNLVIPYLENGQAYYFAVLALDSSGDSTPWSNEASAVTAAPAPMILSSQTFTDGNGQPYLEINTPSTVFGWWEMDCSTNLQDWTLYCNGYGSGNGDGYDVDVDVPIDPTAPPTFFRVVQ
jgi:YHS domain-containing protein